jgi:hypothetical protein
MGRHGVHDQHAARQNEDIQMKFLLFAASAGSVIGGGWLLLGLKAANGAPQEAAVGAIACAFAVVPYVLARCNQLTAEADRANERHSELLKALEALRNGTGGRAATEPAVPAPVIASDHVPTEAEAWAKLRLTMGRCSGCGRENNLAAIRCAGCGCVFSPGSNPRLEPLG